MLSLYHRHAIRVIAHPCPPYALVWRNDVSGIAINKENAVCNTGHVHCVAGSMLVTPPSTQSLLTCHRYLLGLEPALKADALRGDHG